MSEAGTRGIPGKVDRKEWKSQPSEGELSLMKKEVVVGTEVGGEAQFQMAWVTGRQNMTSG